jgi:ABC transporter
MAEPRPSGHGLFDAAAQASLDPPDAVRGRVGHAGDALAEEVRGCYPEASCAEFCRDNETGVRCELIEGTCTPRTALLASVRPPDDRRRAGTFSGGNQQKLLLARAVLANPEVLIIDQPTAGVDVGTKAQIHRLLRGMADQGKAVLVISDDIDEIVALSDRLLVMRNGRLVAERSRASIDRDELLALISVGAAAPATTT